MTGTGCLSLSLSLSLFLLFLALSLSFFFFLFLRTIQHSKKSNTTFYIPVSSVDQKSSCKSRRAGRDELPSWGTHELTHSRAERECTYSSRGSLGLSPSSVCFTFSFFSCLSGTSFTPPSLSRDEKEPPEESTLLTGSRLPKIFSRRIIRGTSSLAQLFPWSPLSRRPSVLQSELVVDAWNSLANDANRLNHQPEMRTQNE